MFGMRPWVLLLLLLAGRILPSCRAAEAPHENVLRELFYGSGGWHPLLEALDTTTAGELFAAPQPPRRRVSGRNARSLPCNEVLDTIPREDLAEILGGILDVLVPPADGPAAAVQNAFLRSLLVDRLQLGVSVLHVCASCGDIDVAEPNLLPPGWDHDSFEEYCGEGVYGANQTHSGLLLLPAPSDSSTNSSNSTTISTHHSTVAPGRHPGLLYLHGTQVSVQGSSGLYWRGREDSPTLTWLYMALASARPAVVLLPHYMGYGASSARSPLAEGLRRDDGAPPTGSFKAYLVRKAYETAVVPLWFHSRALVRLWSGDTAALADTDAVVAGYSEGGYAAVVAAHALSKAGVGLSKVYSGAGPYKVASEAVLGLVESLDGGRFPTRDGLHILALLGAAYSSTYPHLSNHDKGQDLLSPDDTIRDTLLGILRENGADDSPYQRNRAFVPLIRELVAPSTDPLTLFDAELVARARGFLEFGNRDPCRTTDPEDLREWGMDALCAALLENDLTELLARSDYDYPIEFCHSPDDEVVSYANLPSNLSSIGRFSLVPGVSGDHASAGEFCVLHAARSFLLAPPLSGPDSEPDPPRTDDKAPDGAVPASHNLGTASDEHPRAEEAATVEETTRAPPIPRAPSSEAPGGTWRGCSGWIVALGLVLLA